VGNGGPSAAPPSSRVDLFPAEALGPGERTLFATRPSFLAGYWGRTLVLALILLVLLLPTASGLAYIEDPGAWFFIAIPVVFLIVVYQQWSHAVYALTNQRLVRISGWRGGDVESVPVGDVLSVNSGSSSGGALFFRYRIPWTPSPSDPAGYRIKTMSWPAVPNSLGSAAWVQQMVSSAQAALRVQTGQERVDERIAELTITCPYCGSRSLVSLIDIHRPVCPFCSAPLTLPSGGGPLGTS
jgi:hypothetical protein